MFPPSPSKVFAIFAISIATGLLCVPHTAWSQQQIAPSSSQTTTYLVLQLDTDARAGFDQNSEPIADFRFNSSGTDRLGVVTRGNVGEQFAVVLDDVVIFAPVIREPVVGGRGQISGNFTLDEARKLAVQMRSAAHPPKLSFIEERTVRDGPPEGQPR